MPLAGVWTGSHAGKSQLTHQALHPLPIDLIALGKQKTLHPPAPIKRMTGVLFVDQFEQLEVFGSRCGAFGWPIAP